MLAQQNLLAAAPQHQDSMQPFSGSCRLQHQHYARCKVVQSRQQRRQQRMPMVAASQLRGQELRESNSVNERNGSSSDGNAINTAEGYQRKFNPFSAKRDIRLAMLNFRYEVDVADGKLVIQPLTRTRLWEATDLLTEVFAATDDRIGLYSKYMRGQIRQYLENHLRIAPDAIVLMALLQPRSPAGASASSSNATQAAASTTSGTSAGRSRGSSHGAASPNVADAACSSSASADSPVADAPAAATPIPAATRRVLVDSDTGVFVGTVEMSYTDATRTKYLTCNPPRDSAYLGNMCTDKAYRRRGYGMHLLRAAEQLTQLASYPTIYLHLRFQDTMAAQMYEKVRGQIAVQIWINLSNVTRKLGGQGRHWRKR